MHVDRPKKSSPEDKPSFLPLVYERLSEKLMEERATEFQKRMSARRSVRDFSDEPVPADVVRKAIAAACSAPSGANKQPWTYCLVSNDDIKQKIRVAAEEEEYKSYHGRMSEQWLKDLAPLGTDHFKPFLEKAPFLIVVFKKPYDLVDGEKVQNYYVNESVGISVGILLSALQNAGLATLTHTPSPMKFLAEILGRPENERPYLLIPVGYPGKNAEVPNIARKPLDMVLEEYF